jgi:hypothetical protein
MRSFKSLAALMGVLALSSLASVSAAALFDSVKSYVFVLNQKNFDAQVLKNRQKGITIVNFYKESGKRPTESLSRKFSQPFLI